ncbi:MAG: UDP-N-acetylenolpyruvoylglucosamine reductase [Flavobacteriales bacterium]|nr:MAG: UDP-N-acetylenolpyruvoylglucosamine reductase [Flavobacteriales bacterium]
MEIKENYSLKKLNTFGIDAKTKYFATTDSVDEIRELLSSDLLKNNPKFILGGGSNILLTKDFDGTVLKVGLLGKELADEDDDNCLVKVGAGENWHQFVLWCLENDYAGVENLSLIPGNMGAAPMQNIGAYGVELKEVFHELETVFIDSGEEQKFTNADCNFAYRDSIFKNELKDKCIITSVTLKLQKKPVFNTSYGALEQELGKMGVKQLSIKAISDAVCSIRRSKLPDPAEIGNAGSFFKNPVISNSKLQELNSEFSDMPAYPVKEGFTKIPAGWLIEKAGWKGKRFNGYGVHENQALVLVNYPASGGANGSDIFELSETILKDIQEKFGVELEREVNVI